LSQYFDYYGNMETRNQPQSKVASVQASGTLHEQDALKALAALAQAQRLRAFRALVRAGGAGLTPGAMALMLDVPASSLSFHLKELVHAHLVQVEQNGRSLIYRADFLQMQALQGFLTENCCAADPSDTPVRCC
jgi:ArsR family transcriptional regulator, arsenate/arsenite/antimonite-responsive transcriptional repressor